MVFGGIFVPGYPRKLLESKPSQPFGLWLVVKGDPAPELSQISRGIGGDMISRGLDHFWITRQKK